MVYDRSSSEDYSAHAAGPNHSAVELAVAIMHAAVVARTGANLDASAGAGCNGRAIQVGKPVCFAAACYATAEAAFDPGISLDLCLALLQHPAALVLDPGCAWACVYFLAHQHKHGFGLDQPDAGFH